jgi:hypothetical protein
MEYGAGCKIIYLAFGTLLLFDPVTQLFASHTQILRKWIDGLWRGSRQQMKKMRRFDETEECREYLPISDEP